MVPRPVLDGRGEFDLPFRLTYSRPWIAAYPCIRRGRGSSPNERPMKLRGGLCSIRRADWGVSGGMDHETRSVHG